jgi:hypothetical protein
LSYATRGKKVNLSTCSEVIQADIDEEVFETPTDLDDMKFSAEEIDAVVEHPCLPKETVSMFDKPKIHTMQAVKVSFNIYPYTTLTENYIIMWEMVINLLSFLCSWVQVSKLVQYVFTCQ